MDLIKMTNSLSHRVPDSEEFYFNNEKGIGLGHRKLSIIELSESANQPMNSHCGPLTMVIKFYLTKSWF